MDALTPEQAHALSAAGAAPAAVKGLNRGLRALRLAARPTRDSLAADSRKARAIYRTGDALLAAWPPKPKRDAAQARAAEIVKGVLRRARNAFARTYVDFIYSRVTGGYRRFVRADELVYAVADLCPGLCPTRREVEAELQLMQAEKDGVEIPQSDFLSHVFAHRPSGDHLIHGMLRPLPQSVELLARFRREGRLDLGTAHVERRGALGCVLFNNLRHLNAEDDGTVVPLETAADLVLLDAEIQVGLLRGNPVPHPKYKGRRVFSAGLNLTHLYQGKLSLMFYLTRDLGFVNKLHRGLAGDDYDPEGPEATLEKPWIGALEAFAIGGGCQILLVLDYVIAEEGAYFNLPARKEGIIPGMAPMRMPRFLGERETQQGILFDKRFPVDAPGARLMVSEVVPAAEMDAAIDRAVANATGAGAISAGANRKAIRVAQEPREVLRNYLALYCREQGDCHFSPALIANLERNWDAQHRPRE
ncbi:MAG TPA: enoyl-CoA hydratase/isomerase family protein [Candidatus Methylomirabilis sp.]|jgi:thioesterase DpgC